ncbi:MAG: PH domain-containing protein [Steroidobacterales bacterium]
MIVEYRAPWSRALKVATGLAVTVLVLIAATGILTGPRQLSIWWAAMVWLPLLILISSIAFVVRGYTLTEHTLEIRRLGWKTILPLRGLVKASGDLDLLRGSIRVFGNGGLFSITGWFWNRRVGFYRAYATDLSRAVFLKYSGRRPVMLTPHDTHHFLVWVGKLIQMGA